MIEIADHVDEVPAVKTIRFNAPMTAAPGQFVMVWVPGVDEFPMSVSYVGDDFGFTYQILGEGTKALSMKRPGSMIGVRGPYGRGFSIRGKRLLVVAGGLGMAPIAPFVEQAIEHKSSVDLVIGAKSSTNLLFEKRMAATGAVVHIATDDGSKGAKGFASDIAAALLQEKNFDAIYTCGPEPMIVKVMEMGLAKGMPVQASLERFMKCGIGICDSCAIDGKHVCKDGPVFSEKELRALGDLGRTKLDQSGRKSRV